MPLSTSGAFELVLGVDRVERGHDRAELPRAELGDEELRAVREQQRHAIAAPDAEGDQRGRERVARAFELAVGDRRTLEEERGCSGRSAGCVGDVIEQRSVRIGAERRWNTGVVVGEPRALRESSARRLYGVPTPRTCRVRGAIAGSAA